MISCLINFSYELGQILTRYDFLEARRVILSDVTFEPTPTLPIFTFGQLLILIGSNNGQI